jgi:hypothetical protein
MASIYRLGAHAPSYTISPPWGSREVGVQSPFRLLELPQGVG